MLDYHNLIENGFLGFLGFLNVDPELRLIQNHLLLIFKIYIYNSRKKFHSTMKKDILFTREDGS